MKTKPVVLVLGHVAVLALLQKAPIHAQATNPPYLREMPSVERVKAEIKGSDPVDISARQIGAFQRLQDVIKALAGPRFRSNEFTPDESRLISQYFNAWQRYLYKDNSPPPQDQARWYKLRSFYETDPRLLDELLQRYFSAEFRTAYHRATGKQPPQAQNAQLSAAPSAPASAQPSAQPTAYGGASAEAYLAQGEKYREAMDFAKALAAYKKSAALNPSLVAAYWGIAAAAGGVGEPQTRIAALEQITILTPNEFQPFYSLAVFYIEAKQYKEAVTASQQALRLAPNSAKASNQLGLAHHGLGRHTEAVAAFKQAIRLEPNFPNAHHNLGSMYVSLTSYQEAVPELTLAIRLAPDYALSYTSLGIAYARMGKKDQALQVYQRLQSIDKARAQKLYEEINK